MMMKTTALMTVLAAAASTASAGVLIDFDTDGFGNPLVAGTGFTGNEYLALGLQISAMSPNNSPLNLFDTDLRPSTGGDPDLQTGMEFNTPSLGNVLIAQDPGTPISNPDDDEDGVGFVFDFTPGNPFGVDVFTVSMLDIEENNVPNFTAVRTDNGQTVSISASMVTLVNPGFPGDNSLRDYTFDLGFAVDQFTIEIPNASGALASLEFTAVPTPGAAALLGLGGLAVARRRR